MNFDKPLDELYQLYLKNRLSKKEFEGRIFQFLLERPERFRLFNGDYDRWNEFLSWLYPRLARAIDNYKFKGSSFDAYITTLVFKTSKEYRSRETDHCMTEYVCWRARAEEMMLFENEPEYLEPPGEFSIPADINPRQVLFLLLKSYFFVSSDYVKRIARAIGLEASEVQKMVDELKNRRSEKEAEILALRDRIHCQHYRCLTYQKRMTSAQNDSDYYVRMKDRYERAEKRYQTMKKRLGGMRLTASNRMIAEVLGVPRGTIDSSLSAIKNRLVSQME